MCTIKNVYFFLVTYFKLQWWDPADVFEGDATDGGGGRTAGADDDYGDGHDQVPGVKQKWKLLPHFLKLRGLMRQHIDSYDYFVNVDISKVGVGHK